MEPGEAQATASAAAELPPPLPTRGSAVRRASILNVIVEGHAPPVHQHVKKLGALSVAVVLFASVAGGPYGIESAVGIGGALPTLIGIVVVSWCWSSTQALMSAELATMFPSDGGFVTWVVKGLGPIAGYVNMCNSIGSSLCNLPLYPALLVSYITNIYDISSTAVWWIKAATILVTVTLNALGLEAVANTAMVFTVIVMTPFIAMPIAAWAKGMPLDWHTAATNVNPTWTSNLSLFISTLCWNAQGWVNSGNISSEVKDPQKSYPRGALGAVLLTALNYLIPVFLCVAISPDTNNWGFGKFVDVAQKIGPWMMYWALLAAIVSSMNNFQPQLGMTARAMRFVALYNMVPLRWLKRLWARHETPIGGILVQGGLSLILINFSTDLLMVLNNLLYNVGLALQFIAFLWLRHKAPHAPRPFKAPWPWFLTLSFFAIQGISWYAAVVDSTMQLGVVIGLNVLFVTAGWAWKKWVYHDQLIDAIDAAEGEGEDATAVSDLFWAETPVPVAMAGVRAALCPCWARCRRPPNTSWMPLGMEPSTRRGSLGVVDSGLVGAVPDTASGSASTNGGVAGLSLVAARGGSFSASASSGSGPTPRADAPPVKRGSGKSSANAGGGLLGRRASSDGSSDEDRESTVSLLSSPYQAAVPDLRSLPVSSAGSSAGTSSVSSSSGGSNPPGSGGGMFVLGGATLPPAPSPILIAGGASPAGAGSRAAFAFQPAGALPAVPATATTLTPSQAPSSASKLKSSSSAEPLGRYVLPTPESIASALRNKGEYIERERSFGAGGGGGGSALGPDGRPRPPSRRSSSQTLGTATGVILRALSRGTGMTLGGGEGGSSTPTTGIEQVAEEEGGPDQETTATVEMELGGLTGSNEAVE